MNHAPSPGRPAVHSLPALLLVLALLTACGSGAASPTVASGTPTLPSSRPPAATVTPLPINTPRPATPTVTQTEVQLVKPFGDSGLATGYSRGESVIGSCSGPSLAAPGRSDAWRCTTEGTGVLRDPCFAQGTERQPALACIRQPWNVGVAIFVLTGPLPEGRPSSGDPTASHPWGIELADGTRCLSATETPLTVAGQRVTSTCNEGINTIGQVDRSQPVWTIQVVRNQTSQPERKAIVKAWY